MTALRVGMTALVRAAGGRPEMAPEAEAAEDGAAR